MSGDSGSTSCDFLVNIDNSHNWWFTGYVGLLVSLVGQWCEETVMMLVACEQTMLFCLHNLASDNHTVYVVVDDVFSYVSVAQEYAAAGFM